MAGFLQINKHHRGRTLMLYDAGCDRVQIPDAALTPQQLGELLQLPGRRR